MSGAIRFLWTSSNGSGPEWLDENTQFDPGLTNIANSGSTARQNKINQANGSLVSRSESLRKLDFALPVLRHGHPSAAGVAGTQIHVPSNCIGNPSRLGKAPGVQPLA